MPNPMQPYQSWPGPPPRTAQGVATGQPRIGYHRAEQWGKYFVYLHSFDPLPASATQNRSFSVDGAYDFLIQKIALLIDNGGVKLQTQLSPMGEVFEQAPIYGSNWGSGQHPLYNGASGLVRIIGGQDLPTGTPQSLPRNSIYAITAQDAQAIPADNTVMLAYHGTKVARQVIVPARRYEVAKPFKYPATFDATTFDNNGNATGPIPALSTRIFNIVVDNAADFDVNAISVVSDTPITVMVESDSDHWFLSPLRSDLLGGSLLEAMPVAGQFSGEWPFVLPGPRLVTAAGYISVTVTNLDVTEPTRAQVLFHGQRLYPAGGC